VIYICIVSGREVGDAGCEDLEAPEIFVSYGDCGNEEILGTVAAVLVMSMRRLSFDEAMQQNL